MLATYKHHYNCAYCIHKESAPIGRKGKKIIFADVCNLTKAKIAPFPDIGYPMPADCASYSQRGCNCEICTNIAPNGRKA